MNSLSRIPTRSVFHVAQRSAERFGEVFWPVDRLSMIVTHLVARDRELRHACLALPLFQKVCRDKAVENEVAVSPGPVHLEDEVMSINCSRSGSPEAPAKSVVRELDQVLARKTYHV
jgi:hypothetical protein